MRFHSVRESYELGDTFTLIPIGDWHMGSANSDHSAIAEVIKEIAENPYARWLGMGDLVESIAPDDKRWNPADVEDGVTLPTQARIGDYYVNRVAATLAPIVDKCWGIADGNHEDKFNARYYTNINLRVLEKLGLPENMYLQWAAGTRVTFEDRNQHRSVAKIFQQHGWQSGRKDGAKINGLDDLMSYHVGYDIYLVAHSHSRLLKTRSVLTPNQHFDGFTVKKALAAHTASALRTYELNRVGYAEQKSYPPTELEPIRITLRPTPTGVKINGIL